MYICSIVVNGDLQKSHDPPAPVTELFVCPNQLISPLVFPDTSTLPRKTNWPQIQGTRLVTGSCHTGERPQGPSFRALHYTALYCTALYCIPCTALHCKLASAYYRNSVQCTALQCCVLYRTALHCTVSPAVQQLAALQGLNVSLHCSAAVFLDTLHRLHRLHCTALHLTALH